MDEGNLKDEIKKIECYPYFKLLFTFVIHGPFHNMGITISEEKNTYIMNVYYNDDEYELSNVTADCIYDAIMQILDSLKFGLVTSFTIMYGDNNYTVDVLKLMNNDREKTLVHYINNNNMKKSLGILKKAIDIMVDLHNKHLKKLVLIFENKHLIYDINSIVACYI